MCSNGNISEEIGCDWVLLYSQLFKTWGNTILDITSFYWFSLYTPKELFRIFDYSLSSFGGGSKIIKCVLIVSWNFLPLSLKSMCGWSFINRTLLLFDLEITYLCWFTTRFISIWFIWYKHPHDILSWWVDWIISNISSWMQKYSWYNKGTSGYSGLPIDVQPKLISNWSCSLSMMNSFPDLYHTDPDSHILQETWYMIIGSCSWYSISPIFNINLQLSDYYFIWIMKQHLNTPLI